MQKYPTNKQTRKRRTNENGTGAVVAVAQCGARQLVVDLLDRRRRRIVVVVVVFVSASDCGVAAVVIVDYGGRDGAGVGRRGGDCSRVVFVACVRVVDQILCVGARHTFTKTKKIRTSGMAGVIRARATIVCGARTAQRTHDAQ